MYRLKCLTHETKSVQCSMAMFDRMARLFFLALLAMMYSYANFECLDQVVLANTEGKGLPDHQLNGKYTWQGDMLNNK